MQALSSLLDRITLYVRMEAHTQTLGANQKREHQADQLAID
jgi:hypothetical protein